VLVARVGGDVDYYGLAQPARQEARDAEAGEEGVAIKVVVGEGETGADNGLLIVRGRSMTPSRVAGEAGSSLQGYG